MQEKIIVNHKAIDRLLDSLAISALLILWAYVIMSYRDLPAIIPIHFNIRSEPDNYGSKLTLYTLPVIATFLFILMQWIEKHPEKMNHGVKITAKNAYRQYELSMRLIRYFKFIVPFSFLLIAYEVIQTVSHTNDSFLKLTLPVTIALYFIPIVIYFYVAVKNK